MRGAAGILGSLLGLGAAGALRRLLELHQGRKGRLAPLGPSTLTLPRGHFGKMALRVEEWSPSRPATTAGHVAAAAWAAPLTVAGALLVLSGGGRAVWDERRGCWVATDVRGPSARILTTLGFGANTLGQMVIAIGQRPSATLLDHEAGHVRQGERLGPLILPLYAWFSARHGYRDNPLERGARRIARTVQTPPG